MTKKVQKLTTQTTKTRHEKIYKQRRGHARSEKQLDSYTIKLTDANKVAAYDLM